MKTMLSFFSAHALGLLLLIGLLCTPLFFAQAQELWALLRECKSHWQNFVEGLPATHLQAHRNQW